MTAKEYALALRYAAEQEREDWPEPQYTAHICLINLVMNLIHELETKEKDDADVI
jgi:hypothetical protein